MFLVKSYKNIAFFEKMWYNIKRKFLSRFVIGGKDNKYVSISKGYA